MYQLLLRITNLIDVEMSFAIDNKTLKFGLKEYAVVTGLNCAPIQTLTYTQMAGEIKFKKKIFGDFDDIDINTIAYVCENIEDFVNEELLKLVNLYFLEEVILPKEKRQPIDLNHINLLTNEEFNQYSWGRVVFQNTVKALKSISKGVAAGYHLADFPFALLAYAYETIPQLSEFKFVSRATANFLQ